MPRNRLGINNCNYLNKIQLKISDGFITNKIIKKKHFIKAYNNFKNKIYLYKWNYNKDNIWSKLIYKYSNSNMILKKPTLNQKFILSIKLFFPHKTIFFPKNFKNI